MKQEKKSTVFWLMAAFLPYLLYGFAYYPILDDFIQYGCYPAYENLSHVYLTIGTLSTRPLASLLDPTFWGLFWEVPGVALALVVLLHLGSGLLLIAALRRLSLAPSPFFLALYLLFPLGMEGRYWLSASTRVVVGLFFAAVALYFLSLYMTKNKASYVFLFGLFQLIACGFYESVSVFCASVACLLFLYRPTKKHILIPVISALNVALMFLYYKMFSSLGALGSRAGAGFSLSRLPEQIYSLVKQLGELAVVSWNSVAKGTAEGFTLLCSSGLWGIVVLILIVLVSLCLSLLLRDQTGRFNKKKACIFLLGGLTLFIASLVPNLLAEEVWLTNRSMFVPMIGLFLMLEPLFSLFSVKIQKVLLFCLVFVCITSSVNEYDVYRRVSRQDVRLVDELANSLTEEVLTGEKKVQVVLNHPVVTEQNALYKDHVKSVFDADWSLSGALRERLGNLQVVCTTPCLIGESFDEDCFVVYLN